MPASRPSRASCSCRSRAAPGAGAECAGGPGGGCGDGCGGGRGGGPGGGPCAGPVAAGPVAAGPVAAGPVAAGPVAAGPVAAGPVAAGPVAAGPVAAGPVRAGVVPAGLAVLAPVVGTGVPLLAGAGGEERRRGVPGRCGGPAGGGQGHRMMRHHQRAAWRPGDRRPLGGRPGDRRPPEAAEDGQHPARVPGVGPGDRDARIRERGMHLLVLGVARHRPADLRQGPDRRAEARDAARRGSRTGGSRARGLDADGRGAADQVRRALLVSSRAAQVHRVAVIADTPAGVAIQPVDRPAGRNRDRVPGVADDLGSRAAGLRGEPYRGPGAGRRLGRGKYPEHRVRQRQDQRKGDYPTHLHPPECDSARNRRGTTSGLAPSRSLRLQPACAPPIGAVAIRE